METNTYDVSFFISFWSHHMAFGIFFSRGIFPTQGLNPGVLHCRQIPYHLSHQRSPRGPYAAAKSLQSCPTLCDLMHCSLPGFSVPGILQARTLEWVAISFSNAWKWKVKVKLLSCVRLPVTPWTTAYQAPPSMGLSRQEYWSGVPLPSPSDPWTWYISPSIVSSLISFISVL